MLSAMALGHRPLRQRRPDAGRFICGPSRQARAAQRASRAPIAAGLLPALGS